MELYDNRYRYVKDLGSGGFGKVFLAREDNSQSLVAIKRLKGEDKVRQQDIIHEMRMVSKFNHPRIIAYKHHFVQDDFLYIVMEYCPQGSLADYIRENKIEQNKVWQWMKELTETLAFVHQKEIVHHDIKPGNILLSEAESIKITDFGVANRNNGTRPYMSPEALRWEEGTVDDVRVDIYALGVTLLELLTGANPFYGKSVDEINEIHDLKDFGITGLSNWQQDIILKAIAKIPEQRFQNMNEFYEAIQAKAVPLIFNKAAIQAGEIALKAEHFLQKKKWQKAFALLDYAEKKYEDSVNVLLVKGKYYLLSQQPNVAKTYFEAALKKNPRLDVQKELGWINLEQSKYPTAISLLSDHLHRNPSDLEAYNLLLQCFYETSRYEAAMDLAGILTELEPQNSCFANNYYISKIMQSLISGEKINFEVKVTKAHSVFLDYNMGVVSEKDLSHGYLNKPTLKSKLLFMDYRFNHQNASTLYFLTKVTGKIPEFETQKGIITFGRADYKVNDIRVPGGTSISRRHCLIINFKDDVWLYDLDSTGTYLNGNKVNKKAPLIGRNSMRIGREIFDFTNDASKLL